MKGLNRDVSRFGWVLVAMILIFSGAEHALTQKLYGRVRTGGEPLLEGGLVLALGIVEVLLGAWLLWRQFRDR